jgi:hypothetical protein
MKTNRIQFYFVTLLLVTVFSSCSIQKRTFNKGYYVDWHFSSKSNSAEKGTSENELALQGSSASKKDFIQESSDLNKETYAENDLKNEIESRLYDPEVATHRSAAERKHPSFSQIMDMPRTVVRSEIKNELRQLRNPEFMSPPARKMSVVLKLAIIFSGLAILSLIIAFWSWYFYVLGSLAGTATVPAFRIFLITGLISLALGLFLFIIYWLTH